MCDSLFICLLVDLQVYLNQTLLHSWYHKMVVKKLRDFPIAVFI